MDLATLKEPSLEKFLEFCDVFYQNRLSNASNIEDLEVFATVLGEKLIPAFSSDTKGRSGLFKLFESPSGLACLVAELKRVPSPEIKYIWTVLGDILTKTNLNNLLGLAYSETSQLVWGSRILNVTSFRFYEDIEEFTWLGDLKQYANWLARRMINDGVVDPKLFDRGIKLGAPRAFIRPFMEEKAYLKRIFAQLRRSQQEFLLTHALLPELPKEPVNSSTILLQLKVCPHMLARICCKMPADVNTIRAAIVVARESGAMDAIVGHLLSEWSSKFFADVSSLANQQALTQYLIAASMSLSSSEVTKYTHSSDLSEGVSIRLASTSNSIRELGTLVAETYAKRSGADLEFGLSYSGYSWWIGKDVIKNTNLEVGRPGVSDQEPDYDLKKMEQILCPLRKLTIDSDDERKETVDSDDEESDEEIDPPYFLKDLISYLRSDKYSELHSGLEHGERVVSRKAEFGSEISQHAEELLLVTCGLNDKYSIKNFNELRQGILNAVLAADPNQVQTAMQMFVTGDWSLAQRQSLLAAVAYAAYSLAQGKHNHVKLQLLPSRIHTLFASPEDSKHLIRGAPGKKELGRSESEKQRVTAKNNLSKVANLFFFPLLAARPPLRKSSYDAILFAQWLRTLGVILAQSYPTHFVADMVCELWPLLTGLLQHWPQYECIVIEALYSTMSLLLDVGGAIVAREYNTEIGSVFDLLIDSLENVPSNGPQSEQSGRNVASQLAKMIEQLNKNILSRG